MALIVSVCHNDSDMANSTRHDTHVGPQGRVVIPAHIRKALDIRRGERLVVRVEDDQIVFERPDHVLKRLRARLIRVETRQSLPAGDGCCLRRIWVE